MDVRTNRFLGLHVGTAVWRRLLISCCTTITAPDSAHVSRTAEGGGREGVQREGGIESNSKLATLLPWAKAQLIADIPGRVPTCATPRPTECRIDRDDTQPDERQNAKQCRRVALSSHRCRPPLLSRCAIHEALRLRCLGKCHSRLSVRLVLLGYANSQSLRRRIINSRGNTLIFRDG